MKGLLVIINFDYCDVISCIIIIHKVEHRYNTKVDISSTVYIC